MPDWRVVRTLMRLRATPRTVWWASFVGLALLIGSWSIATPLFGSPDEPAHTIRAVSLVRGKVLGPALDASGTVHVDGQEIPSSALKNQVLVTVPNVYSKASSVGCYAFLQNVTAACFHFSAPSGSTQSVTAAGRYPPVFYALVGWPSLVLPPGAFAVYVMRLVAALLSAGLLASALVTVFGRAGRRPVVLGFAIAVTPAVLYFAGMINPNGLEITAATALWVHAIVLFDRDADRIDARLVARAGIAASVLVVCRQLSPLWLAIIAVTAIVLSSRTRVTQLAAARVVRRWVAVVVAATVAQLAWQVLVRPLDTGGSYANAVAGTLWSRMRISTGRSFEQLREMVGVFGWLDTPAPYGTLVLWLFALGGLVALAVIFGRTRYVWAMLGLAAVVMVLPIVGEAYKSGEIGIFWQGRYTLPLAVGIPLLAGFALSSPDADDASPAVRAIPWSRVAIALGLTLGAAQILAFYQSLRRFVVGYFGALTLRGPGAWHPPLPALLIAALFVALVAAWYVFLLSDETVGDRVGNPGHDHVEHLVE